MKKDAGESPSNYETTLDSLLPYDRVFLRSLAWEYLWASIPPKKVGEALQYLQNARIALGIEPLKDPAARERLQVLRRSFSKDPKASPLELIDATYWRSHWSLLHLPSHLRIRVLARDAILIGVDPRAEKENFHRYRISFRYQALPIMEAVVGTGKPPSYLDEDRRGLYMLNTPNGLYLGQSSEFATRYIEHAKRQPKWWYFVSPVIERENGPNNGGDYVKPFAPYKVSLDTLFGAESLWIGFWSEICKTDNKQKGKDTLPEYRYLQEAILLVEAAAASLVWLLTEGIRTIGIGDIIKKIPFHRKHQGWPDGYLNLGNIKR
ncbi:MAG: hypothetical protein FJY67_00820 [Calditrichaeota bacterium]|nr:hypothetical protein [Calditrichota bacterium]